MMLTISRRLLAFNYRIKYYNSLGRSKGSISKERNAIPLISLANKWPIQDRYPRQSASYSNRSVLPLIYLGCLKEKRKEKR